MSTMQELRNRNNGMNKQMLSDSDYVLRDKAAEAGTNTFDITGRTDKYQEELAKLKADARREVEAQLLSGDFLDKLKAQLRAEMAEDAAKASAKAK